MVFSYYRRLSAANRRIYAKSDRIERVVLPAPARLHSLIPELQSALLADDRSRVQDVCGRLAAGMLEQLGVRPVDLRVLAVRPSNNYGELHGLYEGVEGRLRVAKISLWMRTAQKKQTVAFRSFLRTLLHEIGHHLDYEHFKLADSFHTEGFYKRESSLFYQLVPDAKPLRAAKSQPAK